MEQNKVRVSVANLVSCIYNIETWECVAVGIVNKKRFENGERFLQAIGGASYMTIEGKKLLETKFKADFLEKGKDSMDARFIIPAEYFDEVVRLFENYGEDFCETNLVRELREELVVEKIAGTSVLSLLDLQEVRHSCNGIVQQERAEGEDTSLRASASSIPTRRLFYIHELSMPDVIFRKITGCTLISILTTEELRTTNMGRTKGVTVDGTPMSNNLFNWDL